MVDAFCPETGEERKKKTSLREVTLLLCVYGWFNEHSNRLSGSIISDLLISKCRLGCLVFQCATW